MAHDTARHTQHDGMRQHGGRTDTLDLVVGPRLALASCDVTTTPAAYANDRATRWIILTTSVAIATLICGCYAAIVTETRLCARQWNPASFGEFTNA